jgi:putative ABC transport system permease protein
MVAVGAEPRMRRRVAGANALLLAILAAVLAIPAGFLPVIVIQFAQQDGYPIVPPWGAIAVVLLIVPLVAAASAGLVSRQPPSTRLLHPIA